MATSLGVNITSETDPCFEPRCFEREKIEQAYQIEFNPGAPSFCAYGRELTDVWEDIEVSSGGGVFLRPFADPRYTGQFIRWAPKIYEHLSCTLPFGTTPPEEQCIRHMCGSRTANPTMNVTSAPYGCNVLVDDDALRMYGTFVGGFAEPVSFGLLRVVQSDFRPVTVASQLYSERTSNAVYGYAVANTYGIPVGVGAGMCGSTNEPCTWDDLRGLFTPYVEGLVAEPCVLTGAEAVSVSCNLAVCNGAGYCGVPTNTGAECAVDELYLGNEFEGAASIGGAAGRGLIDAACLAAPPRCYQRLETAAAAPELAQSVARTALAWVDATIAESMGTFNLPFVESRYMRMYNWYFTPPNVLDPPLILSVMQGATAAVSARVYANLAPATCALAHGTAVYGQSTDCTDEALTPPASVPHAECVVTDYSGTVRRQCVNRFASSGGSPDGFLLAPPHEGLPDLVTFAVCANAPAGTDTWCTTAGPPPPGADVSCLVQRCDGYGGCGWYSRENGSPCGGEIPPPEGWGCVRDRCITNSTTVARCVPTFEPPGRPCSVGSTCVSGATCDGQGQCTGGAAPDNLGGRCVPCASDDECTCTGVGPANVGVCVAALGVCSEPALQSPYAVPAGTDATTAAPLQPWERQGDRATAGGCTDGRCAAPEHVRRCTVGGARPPPLLACLADRVGMCYSDGSCGLPSPLRQFAYVPSPPHNVTTESLSAAHAACEPNGTAFAANFSVPGANGTVACAVGPAHEGWFVTRGSPCASSEVDEGCAAATCEPLALVVDVASTCESNATTCVVNATSVVSAAAEACTPAATHPMHGDLCVTSWACEPGFGRCSPVERRTCNDSLLFYPGQLPPRSGPPRGADYGQCTRPATCHADTGICSPTFEPAGTRCTDECKDGDGTAGACDGAGTCRRGSAACSTNSPCVSMRCVRQARLDVPVSAWAPIDAEPEAVGRCVGRATELVSPFAGSVGCSDGNMCTRGDVCIGTGQCTPGASVTCAPTANPCLEADTCANSTGRCVHRPRADGSPCFAPSTCTYAGFCNRGACTTSPVQCPPAPAPPPGAGMCAGASVACSPVQSLVTSGEGVGWVIVGAYTPAGSYVALGVVLPPTLPPGLLGLIFLNNGVQVLPLPGFVPPTSILAGMCIYSATRDGYPCEHDDKCVTSATCTDGECVPVPGETLRCASNFSDACTQSTGTCVPGVGCAYPPALMGTPCNDYDRCTVDDVCDGAGACAGTPIDRCPKLPGECTTYGIGAACGNGCTPVVGKPDGTQCGCNDGTCFRECRGGLCVIPPPVEPVCAEECGVGWCCVPPGVCVCAVGFYGPECTAIDDISAGPAIFSALWSTACAFLLDSWFWLMLILIALMVPIVLCGFAVEVSSAAAKEGTGRQCATCFALSLVACCWLAGVLVVVVVAMSDA